MGCNFKMIYLRYVVKKNVKRFESSKQNLPLNVYTSYKTFEPASNGKEKVSKLSLLAFLTEQPMISVF